jgi:hypothetical protein
MVTPPSAALELTTSPPELSRAFHAEMLERISSLEQALRARPPVRGIGYNNPPEAIDGGLGLNWQALCDSRRAPFAAAASFLHRCGKKPLGAIIERPPPKRLSHKQEIGRLFDPLNGVANGTWCVAIFCADNLTVVRIVRLFARVGPMFDNLTLPPKKTCVQPN